ncbi:alpha/beta hydrolase [Tomitella biformata]|uniref:alpha/beta hydrolase n=1 Tax=Tomitella biformata TaxID=630403 RepID=UPI00056E80F0|nr:alpha/beta hydrolase [Tomitella biformata]
MRLRGRGLGRAWLLAVLVAVAGCGTPAQVVGGQDTPADLARFYGQELAWGSCAGFAVSASYQDRAAAGFLCARLNVPLAYEDPTGPTAQIAVIKAPGQPTAERSLVVNPGGPGASGLEWALGEADYVARGPLGDGFDVVSFDPRGVGASTPRIECLGGAEMDAVRAGGSFWGDPAGVAAAEGQDQEFIDACVSNTGAGVLAAMGTRSAAHDLDILRAALGDRQLTYLGFSYGTLLGTVYAQEFPGRVRALVLDGAVDPAEDPAAALVNQGAGFQDAFNEFARDCAQVSDCALGDDPARAVARYRELVDGLRGAPAQTTDPRGLSESDALTGTIQALYSTSMWGTLRSGLAELADARGDSLLLLADIYEGRDDDGRYQSNIAAAFTAIRCVDVRPGFTGEERAATDAAYRAAAPFLDNGHGTGQTPRDICDRWPVPATLNWTPEIPEIPRTVVISTTQDSATPYQAGVDLAKLLGAALITVEGTSHTATFGNVCVDEAINAYLLDLTVPADEQTCPG